MNEPIDPLDTVDMELPRLDSPIDLDFPESEHVQVEFGAISHPGNVRTNNEDHFLIFRLGRSMEQVLTNLPEGEIPERFEEQGYAMVVADGMGGMAAGEIASRLALKTGVQLLLNDVKWNLNVNESSTQEIRENMASYFQTLDYTLTEHARGDSSLAGMGTTLSVAYSIGFDLFTVHVGDSRIYLFRDQQLNQLTRDHTVAQSLADAGEIGRDEISKHKQRHVLTHAIGGSGGMVAADIHHEKLQSGDLLLMCSDGLSDMVADEEIAAVLADHDDLQSAAEKLLEEALQNGGKDNVTIVVAKYSE